MFDWLRSLFGKGKFVFAAEGIKKDGTIINVKASCSYIGNVTAGI